MRAGGLGTGRGTVLFSWRASPSPVHLDRLCSGSIYQGTKWVGGSKALWSLVTRRLEGSTQMRESHWILWPSLLGVVTHCTPKSRHSSDKCARGWCDCVSVVRWGRSSTHPGDTGREPHRGQWAPLNTADTSLMPHSACGRNGTTVTHVPCHAQVYTVYILVQVCM